MARREERSRESSRLEDRVSAARREIRDAVDKGRMLAAIRAAGARDADPEAMEAIAALAEERMAEVIARSVESNLEREHETARRERVRAGSVAVAAQREAEERLARREARRILV